MGSLHIFRLSRRSAQASRRHCRGFTFVEIVVVLGLAAIIAVSAARFSLPALGQYSCAEESETVKLALERARHIAQFEHVGDVEFEPIEDRYEIKARHLNGHTDVLLDAIARRTSLPVFISVNGIPSITILFKEKSADLEADFVSDDPAEAQIVVGDSNSACHTIIHINNFGTVL